MPAEKMITLNINGRSEETSVAPHRTLLEALRELGHVEVKSGCEKGDCGACAVLVDGIAVDSCLTLAWMAEGRQITTVSGLGNGDSDGNSNGDSDTPHPLQQAFTEGGGIQCGYCTPGMIIAAKSMIDRNADPSEDDIRFGLSGNLCRCTGYTKIFEAVSSAASVMRTKGRDR
jgi:carbon-monoxide dehydrogenase small subunit